MDGTSSGNLGYLFGQTPLCWPGLDVPSKSGLSISFEHVQPSSLDDMKSWLWLALAALGNGWRTLDFRSPHENPWK